MKKSLLTAAIAFAALGSFAQGYVNFANTTTSYISNILTGARVPTGPGFLAQLYYGPAGAAESALVSVSTAPVNFGLAGRITAGGRFLDNAIVTGGATGTFQIRAWETALGADYPTAFANWSSGTAAYAGLVLGSGNLVQVATANGGVTPLPTPAPLAGLQSFYLVPVPEPSVIALGALGLAAVLWRRRK